MRKVREELEKGHRATLVVAEKRGHSHGKEEKDTILSEWLKELEDIAREWAPRGVNRDVVIVQLQHKDRELRHRHPVTAGLSESP